MKESENGANQASAKAENLPQRKRYFDELPVEEQIMAMRKLMVAMIDRFRVLNNRIVEDEVRFSQHKHAEGEVVLTVAAASSLSDRENHPSSLNGSDIWLSSEPGIGKIGSYF